MSLPINPVAPVGARKLSLPMTISVTALGAAVLSGCGAKQTQGGDGGICGPDCGILHDADGGVVRTEDGGVQCLC